MRASTSAPAASTGRVDLPGSRWLPRRMDRGASGGMAASSQAVAVTASDAQRACFAAATLAGMGYDAGLPRREHQRVGKRAGHFSRDGPRGHRGRGQRRDRASVPEGPRGDAAPRGGEKLVHEGACRALETPPRLVRRIKAAFDPTIERLGSARASSRDAGVRRLHRVALVGRGVRRSCSARRRGLVAGSPTSRRRARSPRRGGRLPMTISKEVPKPHGRCDRGLPARRHRHGDFPKRRPSPSRGILARRRGEPRRWPRCTDARGTPRPLRSERHGRHVANECRRVGAPPIPT